MRGYWVVWPHPRLLVFAAMMDAWSLPFGSGSVWLPFSSSVNISLDFARLILTIYMWVFLLHYMDVFHID